jgi:hypothetical protein
MFRNALVAVMLSVGVAGLGGCAGQVTHATPSGKAEQVFAAPPDKVKPALVGMMSSAGFNLVRDTSYQVAFDKPVENLLVGAFLGSGYNATPNERVAFTLVPLGPNTRVIADISVVTNPGSAFERLTPFNNGPDSENIQDQLEFVAISNRWQPKP